MNVEGEIKHLIAAIQRLGSKSKGVLDSVFFQLKMNLHLTVQYVPITLYH
jgi:hypothetical protein